MAAACKARLVAIPRLNKKFRPTHLAALQGNFQAIDLRVERVSTTQRRTCRQGRKRRQCIDTHFTHGGT